MNFGWTRQDELFRARVREFLARELPQNWDEISRHGPGSREQTEFSLAFCPRLAAAGLLVPHWPEAYGGTSSTPWEQLILGEEMWAAGEPRGAQYMNVNWIGPTLMRFGSEAQKQFYLPEIAAGEGIWCQGFSEPSSGSDLASLRTRAESAGDSYVINGSKVWTSYAALADHCFLLARTGGSGKAGIAILLVPMTTPGIVVRPIPSLIGMGDIHEVFFENVVVAKSCRLGEEGQAWPIITFALSNERVGIPRHAFSLRVLGRMVDQLKREGRFDDPVTRFRAGQAMAACEAARLLVYRVVDQRARQLPPSADASVARVAVVAAEHAVADFAMDFLPDSFSGTGFPIYLSHHERAIVAGIASGAAEIQLNLVAHDYLRLPREPKP
jgi:alkylation response protein AidB-like acyl-CoA dehydrogenase